MVDAQNRTQGTRQNESDGLFAGLLPEPGPRVLNKHKAGVPEGAVYIGRPSPYGNPFEIGRDGTRDEVCDKFEEWVQSPENESLRERAIRELRGRDLVCWCAPKRCHGEAWLRIANSQKGQA